MIHKTISYLFYFAYSFGVTYATYYTSSLCHELGHLGVFRYIIGGKIYRCIIGLPNLINIDYSIGSFTFKSGEGPKIYLCRFEFPNDNSSITQLRLILMYLGGPVSGLVSIIIIKYLTDVKMLNFIIITEVIDNLWSGNPNCDGSEILKILRFKTTTFAHSNLLIVCLFAVNLLFIGI